MSYQHLDEFFRDSARLIAQGASLAELNRALANVPTAHTNMPTDLNQRVAQLAITWAQSPLFVPIRFAELFDGASVEHDDDYVLAMIGALGGRHYQEIRLHMLREDTQLREETFWRIFEVEGGGEISLANIDKFSRAELNWHQTVLLLVAEGTLDRTRVLQSCLQALNRDFSAYRAGWFSRLYTALKPSATEAAMDQDLLRLCLSATVGATVSLAVKHLSVVHKAGALEIDAFVRSCAPALTTSKAAALSVLKILDSLMQHATTEQPAILEPVFLALEHPHAEVQRQGMKLLATHGCTQRLGEYRSILAPTIVAEYAQLFGTPQDAAVHGQILEIDSTPAQQPVPFVPEPVIPWNQHDALARYALILEDSANAMEVELALAWLAECEQAGEILAPLAKRARKLASDDTGQWVAALLLAAVDPAHEFLPQRYTRQITMHVVDGKLSTGEGELQALPSEEQNTVLPSLVTRFREVASMLQGKISRRTLLATPTHPHGWIDAQAFLSRVASHGELAMLPADLTQALLRIRRQDQAQIQAATGLELPESTVSMQLRWRTRESSSKKADGSAQWVWWDPIVEAGKETPASPLNPALIPSTPRQDYPSHDHHLTSDLVTAQLGLVNPASTLPLVAVGVHIMHSAAQEGAEHRAALLLSTLAAHTGLWSSETAQIVALGLSAVQVPHRIQAAELFAAAIPARISASDAAAGFSRCAPACLLTRWAAALEDAATLNPGAVIALLSELLPRLERKTRGMGALLKVLLDESLRSGHVLLNGSLRSWLEGFSGSSAPTKTARMLLTLDTQTVH